MHLRLENYSPGNILFFLKADALNLNLKYGSYNILYFSQKNTVKCILVSIQLYLYKIKYEVILIKLIPNTSSIKAACVWISKKNTVPQIIILWRWNTLTAHQCKLPIKKKDILFISLWRVWRYPISLLKSDWAQITFIQWPEVCCCCSHKLI